MEKYKFGFINKTLFLIEQQGDKISGVPVWVIPFNKLMVASKENNASLNWFKKYKVDIMPSLFKVIFSGLNELVEFILHNTTEYTISKSYFFEADSKTPIIELSFYCDKELILKLQNNETSNWYAKSKNGERGKFMRDLINRIIAANKIPDL